MPRLLFAIAALVGSLAWNGAAAQTYPQRTVKFILPFGPASGTDITARLVSERLAARWGKPVVIENRPGGDGLVAINAFIGANDDHTLLWVPVGTFAMSRLLLLRKPDIRKSALPLAAAALYLPGLARTSSKNSRNEPTPSETGADSARYSVLTLATGMRSRSAS